MLESPHQLNNFNRKVTFDRPYGNDTVQTSKHLIDSPRPSPESEMTPAIQPQPNLLHGSYTQIMVKSMQLQEHKFTAWLERLVEARKNRQNKKQCLYRTYRKPYNDAKVGENRWNRPQLGNKIKPAQELEVQQIMDNFNCQYDDVVEAVDLYNLDVDESQTA